MGRLFNADESTLDKLFSGKSQLLKRNCDKATALKYKQAIEQAGALPVIKALAAEPATPPPEPTNKAMSARERIAALAAAPDMDAYARATQEPVEPPPAPGELHLLPLGTSVLEIDERAAPATSTVTPPALELDNSGQRLSAAPPPAPAPPDTSHLSEGGVGEKLPTLPSAATPVSPDTSAIDLSPTGTDFSDCAKPEHPATVSDLPGIDLAPAGAELVEQQYRRNVEASPPPTDHLALDE
jgi:hypothetical protein